jgi:tRNA 2-selenouridine synthase
VTIPDVGSETDSSVASSSISAEQFWELNCDQKASLSIVDVRSPSEYAQGHIPGAINVPVFTDQQRADIGKVYKQSGRQPAVVLGLDYVAPRLSELVRECLSLADSNGRLLLHCWRGGMRSGSVAEILKLAELEPLVLSGGYKAFRAMARRSFEQPQKPRKLRVISGLTGSGKTKVLGWLRAAGEQVIDLEGLANHRGSAFGGIGQPQQPTTEQFENDLFAELSRLDPTRPVWVEDEGNHIGSVVVPQVFYEAWRVAPAVCIACSEQQRMSNLLEDYGDLPADGLLGAIGRIRKRLDGAQAQVAIDAIDHGDIATAIKISLVYYDKTYQKAMLKMPRATTVQLDIDGMSEGETVAAIRILESGLQLD